MSELVLKRSEMDGRVRFERHLQNPLVRSTCPEEDRVDRIRRRLDADVPQGDVDVRGSGRLLDLVEDLAGNPLRRLELRAGRRLKAELELVRPARRKDLAAESQADHRHDSDG